MPFVQYRPGYAAKSPSAPTLIPVRFSNFWAQAYTGDYQK